MKQSRGRARLGLLVPFTNSNFEPDMALMCPDGISLHVARMGGYDQDAVPDETQMQGLGTSDLGEPLRLLMGVRPDVILYGCTSATLTHGVAFDKDLATQIKSRSGAETVTAAGALVHALASLNARRIAFASPYVSGINDMAVGFLATMGFDTVSRADMDGELDNEGQGALTPDDVFALSLEADHRDADVLVLSCTDMRSVETLSHLENTLGKPVISSNQAMLFQTLQLLGLRDRITGFGSLFEKMPHAS